jgi:NurA-like 5'-3' nuclease
MHTGAGDNIVRVEVPEWVATSQSRLDIVHDALLQQCRQTDGYPYSLVRAHELAVVSNLDRQNLESFIQNRLIDHGLSFSQSRKAETKRWTGRKRRFQI